MLEDLGFGLDEERLDLRIVSQRLNEEIEQAMEILRFLQLIPKLEYVMIIYSFQDIHRCKQPLQPYLMKL